MNVTGGNVVPGDYETESGLAGRKRAYQWATGPDAPTMAFDAVTEVAPRRVLEVGCGEGELAERVSTTGAEVMALDTSARMVELTRARGVDAWQGDVTDLPFADGTWDVAVAAWMLYHVDNIARALAELARVLRPGGRLVAATNGLEHVGELRRLVGLDPSLRQTPFSAENGEALLREHFARVEIRDARGTIEFPTREAVRDYMDSSRPLFGAPDAELPEFDLPFIVPRAPVIFVATKAPA